MISDWKVLNFAKPEGYVSDSILFRSRPRFAYHLGSHIHTDNEALGTYLLCCNEGIHSCTTSKVHNNFPRLEIGRDEWVSAAEPQVRIFLDITLIVAKKFAALLWIARIPWQQMVLTCDGLGIGCTDCIMDTGVLVAVIIVAMAMALFFFTMPIMGMTITMSTTAIASSMTIMCMTITTMASMSLILMAMRVPIVLVSVPIVFVCVAIATIATMGVIVAVAMARFFLLVTVSVPIVLVCVTVIVCVAIAATITGSMSLMPVLVAFFLLCVGMACIMRMAMPIASMPIMPMTMLLMSMAAVVSVAVPDGGAFEDFISVCIMAMSMSLPSLCDDLWSYSRLHVPLCDLSKRFWDLELAEA